MVGRRRNPDSGRYELAVLTVFTFEGELIAAITAFIGPTVLGRFRPGEVVRPRRQRGEAMSERDGHEPGVPCWVGAALPDPGGAAFTVSQLVVASQGA